jgi:hypothetical protein
VVSGGPGQVRVTRHRDPLEGQALQVLGRLRRHGDVELLVILPDGSKRMIPQAWTDQEPAVGEDDAGAAATLGGISDLLAASALVSALSACAAAAAEQAARQSPCKEDNHAACAAQSAAGPVPGATPDGVCPAPGGPGHRGDHNPGPADRQGSGGERPGRERRQR